MAVTIKQTEASPEAYPDAPDGLSTAAAALPADMIWQRIEAYTAHRWSERDVAWIVEGCGEWTPPLAPAAIATTEIWQSDAWQAVELAPSPLGGYTLPGAGPYRITGTAGEDDAEVAAAVLEAFRRLAEYMAAETGTAGARTEATSIENVGSESIERSPAWMAMAMQNSGAADLLRRYRRA